MTIPGRALPRYTETIMWPLEVWTPDGGSVAVCIYPAEFERLCEEDAIWGRGSKKRLRRVFWHERAFEERGLWKVVRRLPPKDKYVHRESLGDKFKVWAHMGWRVRQAEGEDARHREGRG